MVARLRKSDMQTPARIGQAGLQGLMQGLDVEAEKELQKRQFQNRLDYSDRRSQQAMIEDMADEFGPEQMQEFQSLYEQYEQGELDHSELMQGTSEIAQRPQGNPIKAQYQQLSRHIEGTAELAVEKGVMTQQEAEDWTKKRQKQVLDSLMTMGGPEEPDEPEVLSNSDIQRRPDGSMGVYIKRGSEVQWKELAGPGEDTGPQPVDPNEVMETDEGMFRIYEDAEGNTYRQRIREAPGEGAEKKAGADKTIKGLEGYEDKLTPQLKGKIRRYLGWAPDSEAKSNIIAMVGDALERGENVQKALTMATEENVLKEQTGLDTGNLANILNSEYRQNLDYYFDPMHMDQRPEGWDDWSQEKKKGWVWEQTVQTVTSSMSNLEQIMDRYNVQEYGGDELLQPDRTEQEVPETEVPADREQSEEQEQPTTAEDAIEELKRYARGEGDVSEEAQAEAQKILQHRGIEWQSQ